MSDKNLYLNNKNAKEEGFKHNIVTDYPRVSLNKNEIISPNDKRGGFVIPYPNNSSENNLFYSANKVQYNYMHTKIYIYQLIHYNIQDITTDNDNIIGELIIEHKSLSHPEKIYTCYLLKTKPMLLKDENEIDKILSMPDKEVDNLDVNLNAVIPKQENCIIYEDKGNKVFVFTTPILVNTASKEKIVNNFSFTTDLFDISPKKEGFSTQTKSLIIEGLENDNKTVVISGGSISTRDAEDITIDCEPIGESVERELSYSIPIHDKLDSHLQKSDYLKLVVNFWLIMFVCLVSYIIVPLFYKNVVIDTISLLFTGQPERFNYIRSADIWITIAFIIVIGSLFGAAGAEENIDLSYIALFIVMFYIASFGLIQIKKTQPDFMTTKFQSFKRENEYNSEIGENIPAVDMDSIGDIFFGIGKFMFSNLSEIIGTLFMVVSILFILSLFNVISDTQFGNYFAMSVVPILVIVNSIFALQHNNKLKRTEANRA
jgi:hypothetical protein